MAAHQNPIKKAWPALVSHLFFAINISIFFINSLVLSSLIWPGEPFHSQEIGLFLGVGTWVVAIVGLISGGAPILGGFLLVIFEMNYQKTVNLTMAIGSIGALFWILGVIWVKKDVARISNLLQNRAKEMTQKNTKG